MILSYFLGCESKQELQDRYLLKRQEIKEKYKGQEKWNELKVIETQLRYIEGNKLDYPIKVEGTYYTKENGQQVFRTNKRKYVRKSEITLTDRIKRIIKDVYDNGHKPLSAYHKFVQYMKDTEQQIEKEHVELIGKELGFKEGWSYFKCKELNIL